MLKTLTTYAHFITKRTLLRDATLSYRTQLGITMRALWAMYKREGSLQGVSRWWAICGKAPKAKPATSPVFEKIVKHFVGRGMRIGAARAAARKQIETFGPAVEKMWKAA